MKQPAERKLGRPSMYTPELAARICARIAGGESLVGICRDDGMPCAEAVREWLIRHEAFAAMYTRAREEQADTLADEIVAIADETEVVTTHEGEEVRLQLDAVAVARNKLRLDARKWVAAKLKPRKYGERVDVEHGGNVTVTIGKQDEAL